MDLALDELTAALPRVRAADAAPRRRRAREARDLLGRSGSAAAAAGATRPIPGLFLAGDWIDTGLPATIESAVVSGHRAADAVMQFLQPVAGRPAPETRAQSLKPRMNSIVVHYQELALKGKNRPWFLGRLVRNLRRGAVGSRRARACAR